MASSNFENIIRSNNIKMYKFYTKDKLFNYLGLCNQLNLAIKYSSNDIANYIRRIIDNIDSEPKFKGQIDLVRL